MNNELRAQAQASLPTKYGDFKVIAYSNDPKDTMPHMVLVHQDFNPNHPTLIRIHSECMTGDVFGSERCDCGPQLHAALEAINEHKGILIYLRQEGRGIGIMKKLEAYQLQEKGMDTAEANVHLGLDVDSRSFDDAITILKDLAVNDIKILTNNPKKLQALKDAGFHSVERLPLIIPPNAHNQSYYTTKKNKMGHLF